MSDISGFSEKVRNKEIDIVEHISKVIESADRINKEYNYFNSLEKELALEQARLLSKNPKGKLAGVAVSIKDAIVAKGAHIRGGSKILEGYHPVYDSTVVKKIRKEGGIIIGTTAQDEFGFGSFSVNVGVGMDIPKNPFDKKRSCGGSSGGAAGIAKKADFPHIALGESTGGSIAAPGSFCGVNALCPTYGRVSRYGLLDYGNSLDKIGPIAKRSVDVAKMLSVIAGHDKLDSTSLQEPADDYESFAGKDVDGMKLGIISQGFGEGVSDDVKDACWDTVKDLESKGATYEEIDMPVTEKYGLAAYYMVSTSEASTNLAKYCGMRYGVHEDLKGNFNEYFTKVRSENLGAEAKRRIILGTFARMSGFRDAFYMRAAKVRTLIIDEYKRMFKKYDLLISPTVPYQPPRFDEIKDMTPMQHYLSDVLLVGPNIAGMPHMSVNCSVRSDLPVGILATADHLKESKLIQFASEVEK